MEVAVERLEGKLDKAAWDKRIAPLVPQYAAYSATGGATRVNGTRSHAQNQADLAGLELAWDALNAQGNRAEATNQLLEIVKRDRKWNDDGARKQLVQFFEAWGGTDEATVEGRKRLSSLLFS